MVAYTPGKSQNLEAVTKKSQTTMVLTCGIKSTSSTEQISVVPK